MKIPSTLRLELKNHEGYIGLDSVTDTEGNEITVSYWKSLEAISSWKNNKTHATIRKIFKSL